MKCSIMLHFIWAFTVCKNTCLYNTKGFSLSVIFFQTCISAIPLPIQRGAIKYVIHTRPGPGPQILDDDESLLDENGIPKNLIQNSSIKRKFDSVS